MFKIPLYSFMLHRVKLIKDVTDILEGGPGKLFESALPRTIEQWEDVQNIIIPITWLLEG